VVALTLRSTYLFALAVLVAAFVALYPYLGAMEMCDSAECPMAVHSASIGFSITCLIAVVAASSAPLLAFAASRGRCVVTSDTRPTEFYLSPDPPPPRLSIAK
jgi:hypothetical protein